MAPKQSHEHAGSGPAPAVTDSEIKSAVKQYYGEELKGTDDLKTSACKTCIAPPVEIRALLKEVPEEITSKFYGCGTPLPLGVTGLRVLDLGSGTGRDCYVASRLVGETGSVTGVDMTPAQLEVANKYIESYTRDTCGFKAPNMKFIHGEIEYLDKAGIPDNSHDIVISNCVINLSPDKPRVLREVFRVLAPGGEMYFSDVYCDRRLPAEVRSHPIMIGECLGGALYIHDFLRICREVGFTDPRCLSGEPLSVDDPELKAVAGDAQFYSLTFRLFKIAGTKCGKLEGPPNENYGQLAFYHGTLPGNDKQYALDQNLVLPTRKPVPVDGNTASILGESWLSKHFTIMGDRAQHIGQFPSPGLQLPTEAPAGGSACCAPGADSASCCAPAPAPASKSACCAPAPASDCTPAATIKAGCCSPAPPAAKSGCCALAPAPTSCCPPAPAPAAAPATEPTAAPAPAGKSCCGPKKSCC